AILLLNKVDIFIKQYITKNTLYNTLVTIFLRKLKYFKRILFLTTNHIQTFNKVIISKIYLIIYTQKEIWKSFLVKVKTKQEPIVYKLKNLNYLVGINLNR
ncbi:hypothetical protein K469DRAFT_590292, partial [Zopfia rhizophila CBS 207.26]